MSLPSTPHQFLLMLRARLPPQPLPAGELWPQHKLSVSQPHQLPQSTAQTTPWGQGGRQPQEKPLSTRHIPRVDNYLSPSWSAYSLGRNGQWQPPLRMSFFSFSFYVLEKAPLGSA